MRCSLLMLPGLVLVGMLKISSADQFSDYDGVKTYADRGLEAENKHDYETARRFFEAAVQRYPKTAFAYWNRGFFFSKRGAYGLALKDFNQAVSLQPKVWMYAQDRGLVYMILGKYDLALADFNRILVLDRTNSHAGHFSMLEDGWKPLVPTRASAMVSKQLKTPNPRCAMRVRPTRRYI